MLFTDSQYRTGALQACSDAVRFLDERKAGMMALLERSVRDAAQQHKVVTTCMHAGPTHTCSCTFGKQVSALA